MAPLFPPTQRIFHVLGCMSGSSLDGLDLALVRFERNEIGWRFDCLETDILTYNDAFAQRFIDVMNGSALDLAILDRDLGRFIGQAAAQMAVDADVDLITSHGHTVFHQPEQGLTVQIGSGAEMAAESGIPCCVDLRSMDMALGGQGAPLVPLGEANLFREHRAFLNLGGIANIGLNTDAVVGYDICICNQLLDHLAQRQGLEFDANGDLAAGGTIDQDLLEALNALPFHQSDPPKSLGREFFDEQVLPLFAGKENTVADLLRTSVEHMALQIARSVDRIEPQRVFTTGGGAFNGFLLDRLAALSSREFYLPERAIITHKEAIIFAFLGLLRALGVVNVLGSVTGSPYDSIGGTLHIPPSTIRG